MVSQEVFGRILIATSLHVRCKHLLRGALVDGNCISHMGIIIKSASCDSPLSRVISDNSAIKHITILANLYHIAIVTIITIIYQRVIHQAALQIHNRLRLTRLIRSYPIMNNQTVTNNNLGIFSDIHDRFLSGIIQTIIDHQSVEHRTQTVFAHRHQTTAIGWGKEFGLHALKDNAQALRLHFV